MLYRQYIDNVQRNVKADSKSFWDFINGKRKQKGIPTNVRYQSRTAGSIAEAADMFAQYFQSVYSPSDADQLIEAARDTDQEWSPITDIELKRKIDALDTSKGAGPDGISNRILIDCSDTLIAPLYFLLNRSLRTGYFPTTWKCSSITPIWKNGSKLEVNNYRGVAILSAIPKMFESIMYDRLYEQLAPRFHNAQHGFMKGKSVVTNLAEFTSRVTKRMLDGYQVDVIYTDLTKAFDRISIRALMGALNRARVDAITRQWIFSYLSNRTQFVRLAGHTSEPFVVTSGVPQGSHLGPLLFVLLMNDLPAVIQNSYVLIYADDVKLFKAIKK